MQRWHHYLEPCRQSRRHTTVIIVDAVPRWVQTDVPGRERAEPIEWWACTLREKSGGLAVGRPIRHTTLGEWWDWLGCALARSGGSARIFSNRCSLVWPLCGLWETIESGAVVLDADRGRDWRRNDRAVKAAKAHALAPDGTLSGGLLRDWECRGEGLVVLEDPPNILSGRLGAKGPKLVWVDVRNYGAEMPQEVRHGRDRLAWIATWYERTTDLLCRHGLSGWGNTAASMALNYYRAEFLTPGMLIHNRADVLPLEERAYIGGRCEAFRLGPLPGPIYHVDHRSMYPAICAEERLPVRLRCHASARQTERLGRTWCLDECIADVTVSTDTPIFPFERDGRMLFPTGTFRTVLCGRELNAAAAGGYVRAWHDLAIYDLDHPLRDYARALYTVRCEAESMRHPGVTSTIKAILNCLPGKFGQRLKRWTLVPDLAWTEPYDEWYGAGPDGQTCRFRAIGYRVWREEQCGPAPHANIALAAFVTMYGRVRLLSAIVAAGWENVHYVDTDSLFLSETGMNRLRSRGLIQPRSLGGLELRHVYDSVEIRGLKHYVAGDRLVCAGLPRGTIDGDPAQGSYMLLPWLGSAIAERRRPTAERHKVLYAPRRSYQHGRVLPDGSIQPIKIG